MNKVAKAEQQKKLQEQALQLASKTQELQKEYIEDLESNPKYSLQVNPEKKYKMTKQQCSFIEHYVQFKNVNTAAELAGIDLETAKKYFISYNSQMEIRRINLAMYHRQFASRLLSIDEIGGYLSSLLMDENVPVADRLKTTDKLRVCDMIIRLNEMKQSGLVNPAAFMENNIDLQLKNLSIDTVKQLLGSLKRSKQDKDKQDFIYDENMTPEENAYLNTLPTDELLNIIEESNKKGD